MREKPLSEDELFDGYRGARRRDVVPDELMPGHMHVEHRVGGGRILVWHRHAGYTVRHPLKVNEAHKPGDPNRETLLTYDRKKLEEV